MEKGRQRTVIFIVHLVVSLTSKATCIKYFTTMLKQLEDISENSKRSNIKSNNSFQSTF